VHHNFVLRIRLCCYKVYTSQLLVVHFCRSLPCWYPDFAQTAQEEPVEGAESIAGLAGCCKRWHAVGVNGFKLRATQTENCLIKKKNWGEYWSVTLLARKYSTEAEENGHKMGLVVLPFVYITVFTTAFPPPNYFSTNYVVSYSLCYFLIPHYIIGVFS
jgi:hypothetical protein